MRDGTRRRGRAMRLALLTGLPIGFGAVRVLESVLAGATGGEPTPITYLPGLFFPWLLFGLMAPAVFAVVERAPLESGVWPRRLPIHVVAGLAFGGIHLALATTLHILVYHPMDVTWTTFYRNNLSAFLLSDLAQYMLLAGVSHALLFHERVRDRELLASRLEARLSQARLEALSNQIHPHFFFNTLNTIAALARRGDSRSVVRVVRDFAELLRTSLEEGGEPLVPVSREVERLDRYIAIQQVRYGDRLNVGIDVECEARSARIPSMVLQPLVENAVKHGLGRRAGPVRLNVSAGVRGGELEVTVADDGPGFPAGNGGRKGGIGLDNVRQRLTELYGDLHTFELGVSAMGGAQVRIRMPLSRASAGEPASALEEVAG